MKALTLRQPWANSILYLGKRIENRKWNTYFRGEFLIHTSKAMTEADQESATFFCEDVLGARESERIVKALTGPPLIRGGIVGIAKLVSVIMPHDGSLTAEQMRYRYPSWLTCNRHWHMREQYGFILEDVRPLVSVPMTGALGFFDVSEKTFAELKALNPEVLK